MRPPDETPDPHATIWTLIQGAAGGDDARRDQFAARYLPLVKRYLGERWRGSRLTSELDDAAQEVFVECLRAGGVLDNVEAGHAGGFRAFLFGAVRNVAKRFESAGARRRDARSGTVLLDVGADEEELGRTLDREWARCLMHQAAERYRKTALPRGAAARQGVEILRLRFEEGLPIREIATRWGEDPATLHRRYGQAREEFKRALRQVVAFHQPDTTDIDGECARLLELLGDG